MNFSQINSLVNNIKIGNGDAISNELQQRSHERLNRYLDVKEDELVKIKTQKKINDVKGRQFILETNEALSLISSGIYRLSRKNVGFFFIAGSVSTILLQQYIKNKFNKVEE